MSHSNMKLSKSAQIIQDTLSQKGLTFRVIELSSSTRTALDAANTIGCNIGQIVKSLLFMTEHTKEPVLILASGSNRVNEAKITKWIGEPITKANADDAREITGFAIGGIPPIGHIQPIKHILIDEDLLQHDELWAAAGTPFAVFCMNANDIKTITGGKIISIK